MRVQIVIFVFFASSSFGSRFIVAFLFLIAFIDIRLFLNFLIYNGLDLINVVFNFSNQIGLHVELELVEFALLLFQLQSGLLQVFIKPQGYFVFQAFF